MCFGSIWIWQYHTPHIFLPFLLCVRDYGGCGDSVWLNGMYFVRCVSPPTERIPTGRCLFILPSSCPFFTCWIGSLFRSFSPLRPPIRSRSSLVLSRWDWSRVTVLTHRVWAFNSWWFRWYIRWLLFVSVEQFSWWMSWSGVEVDRWNKNGSYRNCHSNAPTNPSSPTRPMPCSTSCTMWFSDFTIT